MKKQTAAECVKFEQIPNIGKAMAGDFVLLGMKTPRDLIGRDPWVLYTSLCKKTKCRQDPCVLDTFMAAVRFMEGSPPHPWWHYTEERKRVYGLQLEAE
ncbi:hypothetical protein BH11PLA2_BH11PLA2_18200 [soil metagenome]